VSAGAPERHCTVEYTSHAPSIFLRRETIGHGARELTCPSSLLESHSLLQHNRLHTPHTQHRRLVHVMPQPQPVRPGPAYKLAMIPAALAVSLAPKLNLEPLNLNDSCIHKSPQKPKAPEFSDRDGRSLYCLRLDYTHDAGGIPLDVQSCSKSGHSFVRRNLAPSTLQDLSLPPEHFHSQLRRTPGPRSEQRRSATVGSQTTTTNSAGLGYHGLLTEAQRHCQMQSQ